MSWTSARARLAAIIRDHPDDHEAIAAARRDLRAARLEDHVRRVVDDDLPLTPAQRRQLAGLLKGGAR